MDTHSENAISVCRAPDAQRSKLVSSIEFPLAHAHALLKYYEFSKISTRLYSAALCEHDLKFIKFTKQYFQHCNCKKISKNIGLWSLNSVAQYNSNRILVCKIRKNKLVFSLRNKFLEIKWSVAGNIQFYSTFDVWFGTIFLPHFSISNTERLGP